jgi:hypothetical protein
MPADRSSKPDLAPPRHVWRVVAEVKNGIRRMIEHRERGAARAIAWRMAVQDTKPGDRIQLKTTLRVNRARRESTEGAASIKPAVVKKAKANRSSKIRRQRSANETRVLTAARSRS